MDVQPVNDVTLLLRARFDSLSTNHIQQGPSLTAVPPESLRGKQIGDRKYLVFYYES
jgi:hypothetical protein